MRRTRKPVKPHGRRVLHEKVIDERGGITELVLWQVQKSAHNPAGIKYRCAYIPRGQKQPAVLYDVHHGKSHHKHYMGSEQPYQFSSIRQLIADFQVDIDRVKGQEGR